MKHNVQKLRATRLTEEYEKHKEKSWAKYQNATEQNEKVKKLKSPAKAIRFCIVPQHREIMFFKAH